MSAVVIDIDTALTNVPTIEVGKQGENGATQVVFDVSEMIETYGSGTAYVVVQRRGDAEPYLLDNTSQSGDKVTWTVSNVDTDVYGTGRVQLFWLINEQVAKTVTYQFYVEEALHDPQDAPVVPGGWISDEIGNLDNLTTTAKANLVAAINEVNSKATTNTTAIGTLANLTTTEKSNLVGAINEVNEDVSDVKEDLTQAKTDITTLYDIGTPSTYNNDKVPYLFRASGGGKYIGGIEKDTIVGGTVAWNQLVQNGNFESALPQWGTNNASLTFENNTAKIQATARYGGMSYRYPVATASGHKLLGLADARSYTNSNTFFIVRSVLSGSVNVSAQTTLSTTRNVHGCILSVPNFDSIQVLVQDNNASDFGEIDVFAIDIFDLTQLFGSTIADHIYSLEQATAGSGIAKLKSWGFFSKDYYPYDSGSLKSVEGLEAHITRDADENIIGNYPLDSDLTLRGIPKLDSSNQLYYDGDIYKADGSVTRKYGVVDLGSLNWTRLSTNTSGKYRFSNSEFTSTIKKPATLQDVANVVCSNLIAISGDKPIQNISGVAIHTNGSVLVYDEAYASMTQQEFKAAMSGVMLVYELATSTTETADPYQNPQLVDKYGTEEYVTESIVPVGHDTDYYLDADSVLTPPSTAGTYSLKVTVASDGSKSYSWVSD